MLTHALHYQHDSAQLFSRIAHQPWAMLLDSGQMLNQVSNAPANEFGRYDIMVAEPIATLVTRGKISTITQQGKETTSDKDPFLLLKSLMQTYPAPKKQDETHAKFPFTGGAMGYFAYDLGRNLEGFASKKENSDKPQETDVQILPEMMVAIYDWALVVDHREKRSTLVLHAFSESAKQKWHRLQALFNEPLKASQQSFQVTSTVESNFTKATYAQAFNKVQAYIQAGDCYQVNLAQRFSASVKGDTWIAYQKLREISPAPFMAYLNLPLNAHENVQVLSNSPERFIKVVENHVETRPIKGTRPRSADAKQDKANAEALLASAKDRAENVMIVDLLRNDISKNCEIGSVKADKLFQLQSFANVHHLVSIVTGKLKQGATTIDLLKGCFPGGSITGAPKVRAMQIIEEIEPHHRGIYCGAIGYIGFDGDMDTNIAIRTLVVAENKCSFCAGGGIVIDSKEVIEYNETLDKASSMMKIMQYFMRL